MVELRHLGGVGFSLGLAHDESASNAGSVSETASLVRRGLALASSIGSDRDDAMSASGSSIKADGNSDRAESVSGKPFAAPQPYRRRLQTNLPPNFDVNEPRPPREPETPPAAHDADIESSGVLSDRSESPLSHARSMRRRTESGSERGGYDTRSDVSSLQREPLQYASDVPGAAYNSDVLSDVPAAAYHSDVPVGSGGSFCGESTHYQSDIASTVASTDVNPPESVASMRTPPSSPGAQSYASSLP